MSLTTVKLNCDPKDRRERRGGERGRERGREGEREGERGGERNGEREGGGERNGERERGEEVITVHMMYTYIVLVLSFMILHVFS